MNFVFLILKIIYGIFVDFCVKIIYNFIIYNNIQYIKIYFIKDVYYENENENSCINVSV